MASYLSVVWKTGRFAFDPPDLYQLADENLPVIFVMWHGQHFLTPFVRKPHYNATVLISRSRDGEMNAIAAERLGVSTIRGSGDHNGQFARKGGVGAFREMLDALERGVTVALTADVPKVARKAGLGVVLLSRYSRRPIIPIAVATHRRIDLKSWDKASVNLPFSTGGVVAGYPIWAPADADDAALEACRRSVEVELDRITARAYSLAAGREAPRRWEPDVIAVLERARAAAQKQDARPNDAEARDHG